MRKMMHTFWALPCIPQILHADELIIAMKTVVLGFGVVVVQVLSQKLWDENQKLIKFKEVEVIRINGMCKRPPKS